MLIHLGEEEVISTASILAILDYGSFRTSPEAGPFLRQNQEKNNLTDLSGNEPKSVIITDKQIYLSPLSSATLKKRATERLELEHGWFLK